ncbi:hypothetical protein BOX15_Mlig027421g3, partial [Macrostomum lignano]
KIQVAMPTKTDASAAAAGTVKRKISRKSAAQSTTASSNASSSSAAAATQPDAPAAKVTVTEEPTPSTAKPAVSIDPIRKAFFFEEEGSAGIGSADNDCTDAADRDSSPLVAFMAVKNTLLARLSEVAQLKAKSAMESADQSRLEALRTGCMTDLMVMKRLNREAQFRLKRARELTASSKLEADSRHLQLQNLLYECRHLQREITRCQDFRSRHETITLAPLHQFARESGVNPDELSEHECTLARLRWELKQREQLAKQLRAGKREAAAVQADIAEKRRRLHSLAPLLETVAKAAEPVESALGLDSGPGASANARWKAESAAKLLPAPLYLLYCQLSAYADSGCLGEDDADKPPAMLVEIIGDQDEAAAIRQAELDRLKSASSADPTKTAGCGGKVGNKDPAFEDEDDEEEELAKSKKKKKKTKKDKMKSGNNSKSKKSAGKRGHDEADDEEEAGTDSGAEESAVRQLLSPHPLSVRLSLSVPSCPDRRLSLQFYYLTGCRVVTVRHVTIEPAPAAFSSKNSLIIADDAGGTGADSDMQRLLDCLYPGDDARRAPGYAVRHALGGVGDDFLWLRRRDVGLAYGWAQRLAGIVCQSGADSKASTDIVLDSETSFRGVADCVRRLRRRADARLQLLARLEDLAAGHLATKLPAIGLPPIASCTLSRPWQRISYDAYCELSCTARLQELALPSDLFFSAAIRCSQQRIAFLALCVPVDYPDRLPLFGVGVAPAAAADNPSSAMLTCSSDLELHEVESEINVHPLEFLPDEADRQNVLPVQLHRLALALEMYFKRHQSGGANPPNRSGRPYRP